MLVITRKKDEAFLINDNIEVTIYEISGDKVKIGIQAPKDVKILRKELKTTVEQNKQAIRKSEDVNLKDLAMFIKK